MSGYSVTRLEDIEEIDDGRAPWRPIRHALGLTAFGINSFTARQAGDRLINEHDEQDDGQEELYIVQSGRATFELDGERVDAPAGSLVAAQPGVKRTAFAEEAGTTVLALGGTTGKAYTPEGWELWAPLHPLYQAGRYDEAIDRGRAAIEAHPEYSGALYNLACCESLAGHTEDAIGHLRLAIDGAERFRAFAAGDSDLDSIREEPAFKELVASGAPPG